MLKVKEVTYFEVGYSELNRYAKELYGHDPEIVASEEWNNDESHSFTISGKDKWTKWDKTDWEKFLKTGYAGYGITRQILDDLVDRGLANPGEYLVKIFW